MQVQVVEDAEGSWLRVRGPVDHAEAQALVKAGRALLREGLGGPLRVDLGGVSFMDASALKTLHRLHELAESLSPPACEVRAAQPLRAGARGLACHPPGSGLQTARRLVRGTRPRKEATESTHERQRAGKGKPTGVTEHPGWAWVGVPVAGRVQAPGRARGSSSLAVVPWPPGLSSSSLPPCCAVMVRTRLRPSPRPGVLALPRPRK